MSAHTIHEDVGTHGLADECERCQEHAEHPLRSLDEGNLGEILQRLVDKRSPRSENERIAMVNVKRTLDEACSLAQANPKAFAQYAKTVWGLNLVAVL